MFCPNCGVKNEDNVAFCKNCGTKLGNIPPVNSQNAEPVQPQAEQPVQVEQPQEASAASAAVYAPAVSTARPRSNHPVLKVVKDMGASPLFLVAVIAFTAAVFFSIVSVFTRGTVGAVSSLTETLGSFGLGELDGALYQANNYFKAIGVFAAIPSVIYLIGLWLIFAGAQQRGSDSMPTSGLTTIKVMAILTLVCCCIALGLTEILCIVGIIGTARYGFFTNTNRYDYAYDHTEMINNFAGALFIGLAIGALIVYVILIVYEAKIISTINAVKGTILTGNPNYKVSGFVAVMNFIVAFFSLFGLFAGGFAAMLAEACSITALICFGILIFKYKSAMIRLMAPQAYAPGFVPVPDANTPVAVLNPDDGNNAP